MQIYEGKSAEFLNFVRFFVDFARKMRGFESKEALIWENYSDDRSIITIIVSRFRIPFLGNPKKRYCISLKKRCVALHSQKMTFLSMSKNIENAWQMVTDCNRLKGGGHFVLPLYKKGL